MSQPAEHPYFAFNALPFRRQSTDAYSVAIAGGSDVPLRKVDISCSRIDGSVRAQPHQWAPFLTATGTTENATVTDRAFILPDCDTPGGIRMDCHHVEEGDGIWVERTTAPYAIALTHAHSIDEERFHAIAYPGISFDRATGEAIGHPFHVVQPEPARPSSTMRR